MCVYVDVCDCGLVCVCTCVSEFNYVYVCARVGFVGSYLSKTTAAKLGSESTTSPASISLVTRRPRPFPGESNTCTFSMFPSKLEKDPRYHSVLPIKPPAHSTPPSPLPKIACGLGPYHLLSKCGGRGFGGPDVETGRGGAGAP